MQWRERRVQDRLHPVQRHLGLSVHLRGGFVTVGGARMAQVSQHARERGAMLREP